MTECGMVREGHISVVSHVPILSGEAQHPPNFGTDPYLHPNGLV